ncbi:NifU-like protein, partial [Drosera capensis]
MTDDVVLSTENIELVLDEIRLYLMADGGNVALHEIDGNVVRLKLQGACGSCPSSVTTMKLGIEPRLVEKVPEVVAVEAVPDEETGLEMNEENIEKKGKLKLDSYGVYCYGPEPPVL